MKSKVIANIYGLRICTLYLPCSIAVQLRTVAQVNYVLANRLLSIMVLCRFIFHLELNKSSSVRIRRASLTNEFLESVKKKKSYFEKKVINVAY